MLIDEELKILIEDEIILNASVENVQPLSIDIHIETAVFWDLNDIRDSAPSLDNFHGGLRNESKGEFEDKLKELEQNMLSVTYRIPYKLKPHETVFVKAKEGLNLPENRLARIVEKNSVMRLGLQVSGPLYQPTHHTAIFLRVTNLTEYTIELQKDFSIAQITFEEISEPEKPYSSLYDSQYKREFNFKPPSKLITRAVKPEEQIDERFKSIESKVYTVFTVFMGGFVSTLCLIVVNFNSIGTAMSWKNIIGVNLSLALCISIILGSVFTFCYYLAGGKKNRMSTRFIRKLTRRFPKRSFLHRERRKRKNHGPTIYLAACYSEHERNLKIYEKLISEKFDVFLPESLHLKESPAPVDQYRVFLNCYRELAKCDIVLAVLPFGDSVSAEIGFAIAYNKTIIAYNPSGVHHNPECMIDPGYNCIVQDEKELICKLNGHVR